MQRVIAVTALADGQLRIRFADGVEGHVDLRPMLGHGVFRALADPAVFAQVFVDPVTHTVAWPNGIDLCPDTLYDDVKAQRAA